MKDSYTKEELEELLRKLRDKKQDQFENDVHHVQHGGIRSSEDAFQIYMKVKALETDKESYNAALDAVNYTMFTNEFA